MRLYLLRYDRLHEKENAAEQALLKVSDAVREAEAALAQAIESRGKGEVQLEQIQQALSQAHDALLRQNDALHAARESLSEIRNRILNGGDTIERLDGEMDSLKSRLRLIDATMNQSDGGMSEAESLLSDARKALEERRSAHASATENAQKLEDELSAHKAHIMDRMNRMQNVRTSQARQSAMQQQMSARREEILAQLRQEEAREEEISEALKTAQSNLQNEQALLDELKAGAEAFEQSTKQLLQDILSRQKQMQEDLQSARAMDTRLRTLKELQDGYEGYQYSVKNALTYAKRAKLSGVHDVVAMLVHVPREYETAMDMALGAAMQNIVTETEQDAKTLIDYLRKNRLGRATFLPLNTIKGRTLNAREREVLSMKGCIGVASELCSYDPIYQGVVENLLGRTVVAQDLESGIAIMRAGNHAFRLVTLQGDVMHSGGSMTGGSIQQKAQNLLGREREMKELADQLNEITARAQKAQQEIADMEAERAGEKERREAAQYELHQQEIAVVRDTERLKSAQADLDAHAQRMDAYRAAVEQLDESLAQIAQELERLSAQTSEDETGTDELNARTEQLAILLDKARRERENAQEMLTDAMLTLQNAEHDVDRIRRDKQRLLSDRENCEKELADLTAKRHRAEQDVADAEAAQSSAETIIAACEKHVEEARQHVSDTEQKRDQQQKELREIQGEIDASQQLSAHETERMHRQEMALGRIRADLSQLNDRLWNNYELSYAGAVEARDEYDQRKQDDEMAHGETLTAAFDEAEADRDAQRIRDRIRQMGAVNVGAIEEYTQMYERFTQLNAQKDDLEKAKADLQALISQLLEQMETVFVGQFSTLQDYFAETFTRLFGGGYGEISLSNPNDPLNCGIEIIVQPPGKKRQLLSLFSGGERALTAIAILFAMLKLKPTPFCILDEIEAALDDANISYFADYLKEFSADTQFIVVTHRKGTMERCDTLFGVAMEERGVSSMVSVNLTDYE